jgi:hypothetical protein
MPSNIERAITDVLTRGQQITVANVFASYSVIAGHDLQQADNAFASFERAMEKRALRTDKDTSAVASIRHQYWMKKLNGKWDGKGEIEMCTHCGCMSVVGHDKGKNGSGGHGPMQVQVEDELNRKCK